MKKEKNNDNMIFFVCFLVLLIMYGKNIDRVCTVWELGDEAGYLSNAAYFLGFNWDSVRGVLPYFGYGYSLILIPAFLLSNNGVELIQGVCLTNLICILGIFIALSVLGRKLYDSYNKRIIYFIAMIVCLIPYLSANTYKVTCEVFLSLWHLILTLLLYWSLKNNKWFCYVGLGCASAFVFFIHTRTFVIIGTIIIVLGITTLLFKNKRQLKNYIYMLISMLVLFIILYSVKMSILNSRYELIEEVQKISNTNLITFQYIKERIMWLFHKGNREIYLLSFIAKNFYIIVASGGMIIYGVIDILNDFINREKNIRIENEMTKLFLLLSAGLMLIVCTLNGAGMAENFTYFFYSRYYEYTMIPMYFIGMNSVIHRKWNGKVSAILIGGIAASGLFTAKIQNYLNSKEIHLDSARIPSFSGGISRSTSYQELIFYLTLICCIGIFLIVLLKKIRIGKIFILFFALALIWKSTTINYDLIFRNNERAIKDSEIALFLSEQESRDKIYMLDEEYIYAYFYSRMQVLMKDKQMYLIDPLNYKDVEKGSYIIRYSDVEENKLIDCELIMEGNSFNLYRK